MMIDHKRIKNPAMYLEKYRLLKYVIPSAVTMLVLFFVYLVKGIYPFGSETIDYFDLAQQVSAFYYHVFDFIHGQKSLFYDPYTGMAVNMAVGSAGCSNISIFNLFFLFVKREMLLESLSVFLCIKMMTMSMSMMFYLDKRYDMPYGYKLIFSIGYAFSGFVFTLYTMIQWLDIAAIFPLLMYFLYVLVKDGKTLGYSITLAVMLITGYYLSFMVLVYIILVIGAVILIDALFYRKENDKFFENYHLVKLFISTVTAIMMSSFILIPQVLQTIGSSRVTGDEESGIIGKYIGIISTTRPPHLTQLWILAGTSFIFSVIAYGLIRYYRQKKTIFITLLLLVIVLSELLIEGVNLLMHFGSYVHYPIRNGFVISFTLIVIASLYIEKFYKDGILTNIVQKKTVLISAVASLAILTIAIKTYDRMVPVGADRLLLLTLIVMAFLFAMYFVLLWANDGKYVSAVFAVVICEIIICSYIFVGKPGYVTGYTEEAEQEGEFVRICRQLENADSLADTNLFKGDGISRVKNPDTSLNANYGLVMPAYSLSSWTHILPKERQQNASALGYSIQFTRLLDSGGTVFSDMLLGMNRIVSRVKQDENLYRKLEEVDVEYDHISKERCNYYIYDSYCILPFGVVSDRNDFSFEENDICLLYNEIYRSISGDTGAVSEYEVNGINDTETEVKGNNTICRKSINISGGKALYYLSNQVDTDDYNTEITVNGNKVLVPSISEYDNTLYPAHFNNNALCLGSYRDETVEICINRSSLDRKGNEILSEFEPRIISVDLDRLHELNDKYDKCQSEVRTFKNGYEITVDADMIDKDEYLMLPLAYDKGYTVWENGKKIDIGQQYGLFTFVPVNKQTQNITIKFVPYGMKAGIVISIAGIVIAFVFFILKVLDAYFEREYKWLTNVCIAGFAVIMIFVYLIPYLYFVLDIFI